MKFITTPVKGMNDFLPEDMRLREHVLGLIRETYATYGFDQIETPAMEHIENLTGRQGGENEKLIFKVLKRGRELEKGMETGELADCGLRYDLTVPLARYYANNKNSLPTPLKALQMGSVWRADKPQKGRFRQFTQCDIDIIGDGSIMAEIELIAATSKMLTRIFSEVGIREFTVHINDRRILKAMAASAGFTPEQYDDVFIILDKMDKIGLEGVKESLLKKEYDPEAVESYIGLLNQITPGIKCGEFCGRIGGEYLDGRVASNMDAIMDSVSCMIDPSVRLEFDPTLVRGMSYYTGTIFEISIDGYNFSILNWTDEGNRKERRAFLVDERVELGKLLEVFKLATAMREQGMIVTVQPLKKNAKFQVETLEKCGYREIRKVYSDTLLQ